MPRPDHPALSALTAVLQDAAGHLDRAVEQIEVELLEARDWPDRGLGLSAGGRAVTPGYLVRLGDGTTYRTDRRGKALRESAGGTDQVDPVEDPRSTFPINDEHHEIDKLRLSHTVEGGIGGWRTSFETDSDQLSDEDEGELRRLIMEAGFFDRSAVLDAQPTTVVHDGVTSRLRISIDRRSREVVRGDGYEVEDSEAFAALARWVSERTPPLLPGSTMEPL